MTSLKVELTWQCNIRIEMIHLILTSLKETVMPIVTTVCELRIVTITDAAVLTS